MPEQVTKLKVLLAPPGDVKSERNAITQVADELNRTVAAEKNLVLEIVRWETHAHPDLGDDPQDAINRQIGPADIFVGILWSRLGTPTKRAESGTIEEFERARGLWQKGHLRHIPRYFKTAPARPKAGGDLDQLRWVSAFRQTVGTSALVKEFKTVRASQDRLRTLYMESFDMALTTEQGWTGIHETWSSCVGDDGVWAVSLASGILSMENRSVASAARYVHLNLVDFETANALQFPPTPPIQTRVDSLPAPRPVGLESAAGSPFLAAPAVTSTWRLDEL